MVKLSNFVQESCILPARVQSPRVRPLSGTHNTPYHC